MNKGKKNTTRSFMKLHGLDEEDYYTNADGYFVFTSVYHTKRGYCCRNGCLHCPYNFKKEVIIPQ